MTSEQAKIGLDQPLNAGSALKQDLLARGTFARAAAASLRNVSSTSSLVLSIEGAWGSGKTSTLAMIEEHLCSHPNPPVVVHFNPWLVGDRDALLRQFLSTLAAALEVSDRAEEGRKVAKELKAYSKAFDVLKLIPGAEPWASLVKAAFVSVGDAVSGVAEHKAHDLVQHKASVESALRSYTRSIIVFIDDIDRLFPTEVFEMIRIVKAVGELPNIGYVLAWDSAYVTQALDSARIPQAGAYLDKIVQVRMPLPALSTSAKERLINAALATLNPAATEDYFPNGTDRLSRLYFSGLRELLAQPRDVARVFNSVALIEPALRGEVVFADIVGLSALMVRASRVFDLLRSNPRWFVGRMPQEESFGEDEQKAIAEGAAARDAALAMCVEPDAAKRVIYWLFPQLIKVDDRFASARVKGIEGHLADPARLLVALQLSTSPGDVSLVEARRFLSDPERRGDVASTVSPETSVEFLEALGNLAGSIGRDRISDLNSFCLQVAKLVDSPAFVARSRRRSGGFGFRIEAIALRAIEEAVKAVNPSGGSDVALGVIRSGHALTVAADLISNMDEAEGDGQNLLRYSVDEAEKSLLLDLHHSHVCANVQARTFFDLAHPGMILWVHTRALPSRCRELFEEIRAIDPSLDAFALSFLSHSFDSVKGQTFALREVERLELFCSLAEFKSHAINRLVDSSLTYPVKSAWRAVVEGKKLYAIDGTEARH